jgi:hypothetical protein
MVSGVSSDRYQLTGDQNQKNRLENTKTGYRVVVPMSVNGRTRIMVVDDPHSVDQAESDAERQRHHCGMAA